MLKPLVVIVDRDRQHALGLRLTDNVVVQERADLLGRRHAAFLATGAGTLDLLADDVVAQLHALVADEDGGAGDQLPDLVLRLAAEGAVERALGIGARQLGHVYPWLPF